MRTFCIDVSEPQQASTSSNSNISPNQPPTLPTIAQSTNQQQPNCVQKPVEMPAAVPDSSQPAVASNNAISNLPAVNAMSTVNLNLNFFR